MLIARWVIPLVAAALIFSGVGLVSAQAANTISGTVTDAQTGEPIQGALVELEGDGLAVSTETDGDGAYEIADVSPGEYSVTASADAYESETETGVEVSDSEGASMDFALQQEETEEETQGADVVPQPVISEVEADTEKGAGDRKGYVGTFTLGIGEFTVTTKPESTEGRPWGQPLKKPAGAPLNLG